MSDLHIAAGSWQTMTGETPDEELVIAPEGPPLQTTRPGWWVVTGWRRLPDEPMPVWVTVQVRGDAGGWASGPCWP